jgi:hypothetical protein
MLDRFENSSASLDGPAAHGFAVTPSDSTGLSEVTRALYVGTGGDVAAVLQSGASLVFVAVQQGTVLPVRAARILATGTTATDIVGLV